MTAFGAIDRVVLGILQMTGALVTATLVVRVGVSRESLVAGVITLAVSLVSLSVFRVLKVGEPRE